MARVRPTPVLILVEDGWVRGTVRTCDVTSDGETCTAIVSYGNGTNSVTTGHFTAAKMRGLDGTPGCPAEHLDQSCQ